MGRVTELIRADILRVVTSNKRSISARMILALLIDLNVTSYDSVNDSFPSYAKRNYIDAAY